MSALLDVSGVTLRYKSSSVVVTATERVSFSVDRSDRFVLLGPSGCGKSTLLKAVGGYMKPGEGKMRINGRAITEPGADRMMQRVAIARGMAMEPDILLMDEPFAALDALTRRTCQDELLQLWEETKFTVLFVTHSIAEAIKIGNRILLLSPHPGRVKAEIADVDQVSSEDGSAGRLEKQIHDLLFADTATAH